MAIVEHTVRIVASPAVVYAASQDYAVRYEWDPFPERIEWIGALREVAKGAQVRVFARSGLRMDVEFVQVMPPTVAAVAMVRGPPGVAQFAGSWAFHADTDGTIATFRYLIKMRRWTLPAISERIARWYFARVTRARLAGLKAYCEKQTAAAGA